MNDPLNLKEYIRNLGGGKASMPGAYETALYMAVIAHNGQTRKGSGEPYIVHPIRVAARAVMSADGLEPADLEKLRIIAVLHDTVEDTDVTLDDIRVSFGAEVAASVSLLTRDNVMSYDEFIERLATSSNELAVAVKIADLADNMSDLDVSGSLWRRYHRALTKLYKVFED